MLRINEPIKNVKYNDRLSSYGIIKNDKGQLLVVEMVGWGFIFVGGKIEDGEDSEQAIRRESLEEIGYKLKDLNFYEKIEVFYDVTVKGKIINCHNIVDFYIGTIADKIQEPTETHIKLHCFYPEELFGKMKLEFQNIILEKLYKQEKK